MAIALVGAIALGVSDLQIATENFTGDAAALVSAMFYGINLLIVEQLRGKLSASRILLWRCAIGGGGDVIFQDNRFHPGICRHARQFKIIDAAVDDIWCRMNVKVNCAK
jgi:drug/metabolite transporter (DMT)-like permease